MVSRRYAASTSSLLLVITTLSPDILGNISGNKLKIMVFPGALIVQRNVKIVALKLDLPIVEVWLCHLLVVKSWAGYFRYKMNLLILTTRISWALK